MEERSALSNLPSYVNARGEEAVNRRVVEETTRLEKLEDRGEEWHMVPFIYNNMTEFPFESLWPITGEQFEALDHDLAIKFPKVHAGRPWQAIIQCYNHTKQARNEFWKAALVKMAGEEMGRGLFDLDSFVNVHGYESLNEGVAEETTRLESSEDLEEAWYAEAILFRRFRKIPLDQEGAHVFTTFYWVVMIDNENAFRLRRQKKIMGKMLAKVLIPFIYKNRVECLDEIRWPITMECFEVLDLSPAHQVSQDPREPSMAGDRPVLQQHQTSPKRILESADDLDLGG